MVLVAQEIIGDSVNNVTNTKKIPLGHIECFKGVRVGTI